MDDFQVRQTHLIAPLDKHFSFVYSLLKEHIADDLDYKVCIVVPHSLVVGGIPTFLFV